MKFRVKVNEVAEDTQKLLTEHVAKLGVSHVLVRHDFPDGHNPHFHMYIDNEYASCQAYRYQIDKLCKVKGTQRSITQCDDDRVDEYIQYLFHRKKGNIPTLLSATIDTSLHQQKAEAVADAWDAQSSKDNVSAYKISQELVQWLDDDDDGVHTRGRMKDIIVKAIDIHIKYKKSFCDYSLSRIIQTAMGLSHNQYWRNFVVDKVMEKIMLRDEYNN